jgi:hypothetical protein
MIITILTGGSGSENIQYDFYKINKNLSLNLIIAEYFLFLAFDFYKLI